MTTSPTERTLSHCRELGWQVDVAEKTVPYSQRKRDLFGFIDVVALIPKEDGGGIMGIQVTSGSNHAARVKKILKECDIAADCWLLAGGLIEVWSWSKRKRKGPDGKFWVLRRQAITPDML